MHVSIFLFLFFFFVIRKKATNKQKAVLPVLRFFLCRRQRHPTENEGQNGAVGGARGGGDCFLLAKTRARALRPSSIFFLSFFFLFLSLSLSLSLLLFRRPASPSHSLFQFYLFVFGACLAYDREEARSAAAATVLSSSSSSSCSSSSCSFAMSDTNAPRDRGATDPAPTKETASRCYDDEWAEMHPCACGPLPLERGWTYWGHRPCHDGSYEHSRQRWHERPIRTVQEFWCHHNHLPMPSAIFGGGPARRYQQQHATLAASHATVAECDDGGPSGDAAPAIEGVGFFRCDVAPDWEDAANVNGQTVTFRVTEAARCLADPVWTGTLLALIGETARHSERINGARIVHRGNAWRLEIWLDDDAPDIAEEVTEWFLKHIFVAHIARDAVTPFTTQHATARRNKSSGKASALQFVPPPPGSCAALFSGCLGGRVHGRCTDAISGAYSGGFDSSPASCCSSPPLVPSRSAATTHEAALRPARGRRSPTAATSAATHRRSSRSQRSGSGSGDGDGDGVKHLPTTGGPDPAKSAVPPGRCDDELPSTISLRPLGMYGTHPRARNSAVDTCGTAHPTDRCSLLPSKPLSPSSLTSASPSAAKVGRGGTLRPSRRRPSRDRR